MPVRLEGSLAGRSVRSVTVVDLSLTGCLAQCEARLDPGAIFDLSLRLDDGPLPAKVRVTEASVDGASTGSQAPRHLAGLEFLGLPVREEQRLRRFLEGERRRRREDTSAR
jgi:hypothetical protein